MVVYAALTQSEQVIFLGIFSKFKPANTEKRTSIERGCPLTLSMSLRSWVSHGVSPLQFRLVSSQKLNRNSRDLRTLANTKPFSQWGRIFAPKV